MCGRYYLSSPSSQIVEEFELAQQLQSLDSVQVDQATSSLQAIQLYRPSYNIAPSQKILAIVRDEQSQPNPIWLQWQFVPSWSQDLKKIPFIINARSETILQKPSFRNAIRLRRCLIPANGYFEWQQGKNKVPYCISIANHSLFAMAGIWESWQSKDGTTILSAAIVTMPSRPAMTPIHDRMPLVLPSKLYSDWLGTNNDDNRRNDLNKDLGYNANIPDLLNDALKRSQNNHWSWYQVSNLVNSPRHNSSELIERVPARGKSNEYFL